MINKLICIISCPFHIDSNPNPIEIPLFRTEEGRYLATCKYQK